MVINTVITPPVPPYQNLPIERRFYLPRRFVITAIALGLTTLVTTNFNNEYRIGQNVRFIIPNGFGTRQLNEQTGYVISLPALNQVEVEIDSLPFDPFIASANTTQAQILAIGDVNTGYINPFGRFTPFTSIPGAFINISPRKGIL
jgi:hypothetical protein